MGAHHDKRFPGESGDYRAARDDLLSKEIELRRQIEAVAAARRALPPGGALKEDYAFERVSAAGEAAGGAVRLSELYEDGKPDLLVYSFMFAPDATPCPSCSALLDGLDGAAPHIRQVANFAVVARAPADQVAAFAKQRGWRNLPLLSSANNTYNTDYFAESTDGGQMPVLNVFTRRNGEIRHAYATELLFAPTEAGQDPRHMDIAWPVWGMTDFTPGGRRPDWRPGHDYL